MLTTELVNSCTLENALDCENEALVIEGFMKRYAVSKTEAEAIFAETKKWLWLAAKASTEESMQLAMEKPLLVIDEMWHNFILHTKQYHQYCMDKFKKFIHHSPTPDSERQKFKDKIANNPTAEIAKWKEKYQTQLSYIYDNLGAETVIKWYEEIPSKYTVTYLESIKKGL
jgi:hypothetical protein